MLHHINATNVISAVVPVELISMFTEEELEGIFCGETELDLTILRKATIYESVSIHDSLSRRRSIATTTFIIVPEYEHRSGISVSC
jgi:hypothetical protein